MNSGSKNVDFFPVKPILSSVINDTVGGNLCLRFSLDPVIE